MGSAPTAAPGPRGPERGRASLRGWSLALCILLHVGAAGAQNADECIARGDAQYAASRPEAALADYEAALAASAGNPEALGKASRSLVDLAEQESDRARKQDLARRGVRYARRAVEADPADAENRFRLARALGIAAAGLGVRERVEYAGEVRAQALEALRIDPEHPGALHVVGAWNAEVMRLSAFERFIATHVLGGAAFREASWQHALSHMERAVAVDPDGLGHRLALAGIYLDVGENAKAREQLELVLVSPQTDRDDPIRKRDAAAALEDLR